MLTSATLSTDGNFDYIKGRLGFEDARELLLGSPFDYQRSTLILAPSDMPEPDQHGLPRGGADGAHRPRARERGARAGAVHVARRRCARRTRASSGRSRSRRSSCWARASTARRGSCWRRCGEPPHGGARRGELLGGRRRHGRGAVAAGDRAAAVLGAVRPGVPGARRSCSTQPFEQYALPQAILRFKQGFGRLIRRKTDRGVMVVLDRRLRSKRYGESFLRSLPPCDLRELPLRDLAGEVSAWLARPDAVAPA